MAQDRIESVVIVGGGIAGSLTAAYLSKVLGPTVAITIVDLGTTEPQAAIALMPPLKALHGFLGLTEASLLAKTHGTMRLGTQFVNWGSLGNRYFHPYGSYAAEFDLVPLYQWWLKSRHEKTSNIDLGEISLAAMMASEGRFTTPQPDRRLIQSTFDYGYHLNAATYRDELMNLALAQNVTKIEGTLQTVNLSNDNSQVKSITLADSHTISGDFFIDCSGSQGLLVREQLKVPFVSWSDYLPCSRTVELTCAPSPDIAPFAKIVARTAGWQWRIPLNGSTSVGYCFAQQHLSEDAAVNDLMDNLDAPAATEPVFTTFENGALQNAFVGNVVAIGDSAGYLEPLEASDLSLIQNGLSRLLALWPSKNFEPNLVSQYNSLTYQDWERARDFVVLHYKLTSRTDGPMWANSANMTIPASLEQRIQHWQNTARLISPGPEVFQQPSWLSVFAGQSELPQTWDPIADARQEFVPAVERLAGLQRVISETVAQMPSHKDWLGKNARVS